MPRISGRQENTRKGGVAGIRSVSDTRPVRRHWAETEGRVKQTTVPGRGRGKWSVCSVDDWGSPIWRGGKPRTETSSARLRPDDCPWDVRTVGVAGEVQTHGQYSSEATSSGQGGFLAALSDCSEDARGQQPCSSRRPRSWALKERDPRPLRRHARKPLWPDPKMG